MKLRKGFVANSSSSSFVCEICGASESGYGSARDYGFVTCGNGHQICEDHLLGDYDRLECNDNCDQCDHTCGADVPAEACPICQFQTYSQPEMQTYLVETRGIQPDVVFAEIKKLNKRRRKLYPEEYITYVLKEFNITDEEVLEELKTKFGTYKAFRERNRRTSED